VLVDCLWCDAWNVLDKSGYSPYPGLLRNDHDRHSACPEPCAFGLSTGVNVELELNWSLRELEFTRSLRELSEVADLLRVTWVSSKHC